MATNEGIVRPSVSLSVRPSMSACVCLSHFLCKFVKNAKNTREKVHIVSAREIPTLLCVEMADTREKIHLVSAREIPTLLCVESWR